MFNMAFQKRMLKAPFGGGNTRNHANKNCTNNNTNTGILNTSISVESSSKSQAAAMESGISIQKVNEPEQHELRFLDELHDRSVQHGATTSKHSDTKEEEADLHEDMGRKSGGFYASADGDQQQHPDDAASIHGVGSKASSYHFQRGLALWGTTALILIIGMGTAAAFLIVGISSAFEEQDDQFERSATDLTNKIGGTWEDYEYAASLIHNRCRDRNFTRAQFRDLYEYLTAGGLQFQAAQFDPNITHAERAAAEQEAGNFYNQSYPHIEYRGIVGFNIGNETELQPRWDAPFYFPIHYMEPVIGNEKAIDLDYHASGSRKQTVLFCMNEGKPALTDRLRLVQETEDISYGVVLMHPGVNLTAQKDVWPRDLASIVIRIPDLLKRSVENQGESSLVYLYDLSDSNGTPFFLGAMSVDARSGGRATLSALPELELDVLLGMSDRYRLDEIPAANKEWAVVVVALPGTFEPDILFVAVGGCIIFVASLCLAAWVWTSTKRVVRENAEKVRTEAEKTALILDNARQAAKAERELNDFLAHEVRNPVSAAMAACSFVKTAIRKDTPLQTDEAIQTTREDVQTIENALKFVSDLLRNMLDMHRAMNKQLKVKRTPTDLLTDVLEPCCAMLTQRGGNLEVTAECPPNLVVMSDRLRLKQVILNLGRNSAKFVEEGYIRLAATIVNGSVWLSVTDSGPGIPIEKRDKLFKKYQESLDLLSQGTGIGLFLCKNLIQILGGDIKLDENYDSGIPGRPGCRFVVDLKVPPLEIDHEILASEHHDVEGMFDSDLLLMEAPGRMSEQHKELPSKLSVLFVDDDPILRKLFARTIKTVAPDWEIREAANGEAAIRLTTVECVHFDLIFLDMYMASTEKQMLGSEACAELRRNGITSRLCGLSANDKEKEFLEAGADCFTLKPFPCEARALRQELCRVLFENQDESSN